MNLNDLLADIAEPDPAYSPAPIWWWSGEPLKVERLLWQMDQLLAMGVYQVVILNLAPSGPLYGSDADDPPFLSEEWWQIFLQVCQHARETGMRIFFYDQLGFSGANFQAQLVARQPEFSGEQLLSTVVEGNGKLVVECPVDARPIAAYAISLPGAASDSCAYVNISKCKAEFEAQVPSRLRIIYTVRQGFDYFSVAACSRLLDTIHGEFARRAGSFFGNTIVGSFQDELPSMPGWCLTFEDSFERTYGIRIADHIHALYEYGGEPEAMLRLRYHQHRTHLAETAFFRPFFDWHQQYGMICGFDQQGPARQGKPAASVGTYADYLATHRWYGAPGADLHGHVKVHSSIAWLYERPRVWIEGFHSTGWGGTLEETMDWLIPWLRGGANLYNPHAVYYSTRGGFWEWAPPSTCWRQPYAMHYKAFSNSISRLCKLLAQGVHDAEIAILYPTLTAQAAIGAEGALGRWTVPAGQKKGWIDGDPEPLNRAYNEISGSMVWMEALPGALDRVGLDYHFIDDSSFSLADIDKGRLTLKGCHFSTVILPAVEVIDPSVTACLLAFAKAGGTILALHEAPTIQFEGDSASLAELREYINVVPDAEALCDCLSAIPRQLNLDLPGLHRRVGNIHILFLPACRSMATEIRRTAGGAWYQYDYVRLNTDNYSRKTEIRFDTPPAALVQWDPADGSRRVFPLNPDGKVTVDFEGAAYTVLLWEDIAHACPSPAEAEITGVPSIHALSEDWEVEYVPTLNHLWYDMGKDPDPHTGLPQTWALQKDGREVWAGFGVYGWRTAAAPMELLPSAVSGFPAEGWYPVVYSGERGIRNDHLHENTLGPKGHIPEEFIDFGEVTQEHSLRFTTFVKIEGEQNCVLAVGSSAGKNVFINEESFSEKKESYLWFQNIHLKAGMNRLDFYFTARRTERLRMHWAILRSGRELAYLRPERIEAVGVSKKGARLCFRRIIDLPVTLIKGVVQVGLLGIGRVYLDGEILGRQGGFDPYGMDFKVQRYDLPNMASGMHVLTIEVTDTGSPVSIFVDLDAELEDRRKFRLHSDASWDAAREHGQFFPVEVRSNPQLDPSFVCLWRRPHPLPGASWLEGPQPEVVYPVTVRPGLLKLSQQKYDWVIPPGARELRLAFAPGCGEVRLTVDEQDIAITSGVADLGSERNSARKACLEIVSSDLDGGVFSGPLSYKWSEGNLRTGSWREQGLESYSGALWMRQKFGWSAAADGKIVYLDLGRVRGTVEARLNGKVLGVRYAGPWRFEASDAIQDGENFLELLVTNTLGPWMNTWSPSRMIHTGQLDSGVMGPVSLITQLPATT